MSKVYLVGAGPGNEGLFTILGTKILKKADVLVFDRLIPDKLLKLVPEGCEQIYVGKQSSNHAMKQEEINKLLAERAMAGKTVVRLKGGDPFLFGRGGEEALYLREKGVDFEVVPGISAALAVPMYAGIPVTHRKISSSYAIITGHEDPTKEDSSIDWEGTLGADTLVFFMGIERLEKLVEKIISVRKNSEMPCALIQNGTTPRQKVVIGKLSNIVSVAREQNITPPALFVVGKVVELREKLIWFENKKLFGKRVVVTRSREKVSCISEVLSDLGAEVIEIPTIKCVSNIDLRAFKEIFKRLDTYDCIIFTSSTGVDIFFENLYMAGLDARCIRSKVVAIGDGTQKALLNYGIVADIVPQQYTQEGIIKSLDGISALHRILIPRAKEGRENLVNALIERGCAVDDVHTYSIKPEAISRLAIKNILSEDGEFFITFASSKTAEYFYNMLDSFKEDVLKRAKAISIGPITSQKAIELGFNVVAQAKEHNINGLINALVDYVEGSR